MIALQIGVFVLLAVWVIGVFFSSKPRIRRGPVDLAVLAFVAVATVATIFSLDPLLSLFGKFRNAEGLMLLVTYGVLYFLAVQIRWTPARVFNMFWAIVAGGILIASYGLAQHFGWDFITWNKVPFTLRRSFATFGNPSLLGGYLVVVLSAAVALYLGNKDLWKRIILVPVIAVTGACMFTTYTRSSWVGGLAALTIIGLVPIWRFIRDGSGRPALLRHLRDVGVLAGVLAIAVGAFIITPYIKAAGQEGGPSNAELSAEARLTIKGDSSIQDRFEIWKSSLHMISDRPAVGQGPDTFQLRFGQFQTVGSANVEKANAHAEDAHDYTLAVAGTMGLTGMAALLTIVFVLIAWGFKAGDTPGRNTGKNSGLSPPQPPSHEAVIASAGLLAATAGYFIDVSFTINVVGGAFLFWLLAGAISGLHAREPQLQKFLPLQAKFAWPATAAASLLAAWILFLSVSWISADLKYAKAMGIWGSAVQAQSLPMLQESTGLFHEAFKENPRMDRYMSDLAQRYVELGLNTQQPMFWQEAKKANDLGIKYRPLEPWFHINAAIIESRGVFSDDKKKEQSPAVRSERNAAAEKHYLEAIELYPNSARAHHFYGIFLSDNGRSAEGEKQLLRSIECDPTYVDALFALAQFYEKGKNGPKAKLYYEQVLENDKNFEPAKKALASLKGQKEEAR